MTDMTTNKEVVMGIDRLEGKIDKLSEDISELKVLAGGQRVKIHYLGAAVIVMAAALFTPVEGLQPRVTALEAKVVSK